MASATNRSLSLVDSRSKSNIRKIIMKDNLLISYPCRVEESGVQPPNEIFIWEYSNNVDVYVTGGDFPSPYYTFKLNPSGSEVWNREININNTYTFIVNVSGSHPFYLGNGGYEGNSDSNITLEGSGSAASGVTNGEIKLSFNSSDIASVGTLNYYCTAHSSMIGAFSLVDTPADSSWDEYPIRIDRSGISTTTDGTNWSLVGGTANRINADINNTEYFGINVGYDNNFLAVMYAFSTSNNWNYTNIVPTSGAVNIHNDGSSCYMALYEKTGVRSWNMEFANLDPNPDAPQTVQYDAFNITYSMLYFKGSYLFRSGYDNGYTEGGNPVPRQGVFYTKFDSTTKKFQTLPPRSDDDPSTTEVNESQIIEKHFLGDRPQNRKGSQRLWENVKEINNNMISYEPNNGILVIGDYAYNIDESSKIDDGSGSIPDFAGWGNEPEGYPTANHVDTQNYYNSYKYIGKVVLYKLDSNGVFTFFRDIIPKPPLEWFSGFGYKVFIQNDTIMVNGGMFEVTYPDQRDPNSVNETVLTRSKYDGIMASLGYGSSLNPPWPKKMVDGSLVDVTLDRICEIIKINPDESTAQLSRLVIDSTNIYNDSITVNSINVNAMPDNSVILPDNNTIQYDVMRKNTRAPVDTFRKTPGIFMTGDYVIVIHRNYYNKDTVDQFDKSMMVVYKKDITQNNNTWIKKKTVDLNQLGFSLGDQDEFDTLYANTENGNLNVVTVGHTSTVTSIDNHKNISVISDLVLVSKASDEKIVNAEETIISYFDEITAETLVEITDNLTLQMASLSNNSDMTAYQPIAIPEFIKVVPESSSSTPDEIEQIRAKKQNVVKILASYSPTFNEESTVVPTLSIAKVSASDIGISSSLLEDKQNVNIFVPNKTGKVEINVSTAISEDTGWSAVMDSGDTVKIIPEFAESFNVKKVSTSEKASTPIEYTITVDQVSGNNKYHVDGNAQGKINTAKGMVIKLDMSALSGHPLALSTLEDGRSGGSVDAGSKLGAGEGVSVSGNILTYTIPNDAPFRVYYYCEAHALMGGVIYINEPFAYDLYVDQELVSENKLLTISESSNTKLCNNSSRRDTISSSIAGYFLNGDTAQINTQKVTFGSVTSSGTTYIGGTAGDPYVTTLDGVFYKLDNIDGYCRMLQGKINNKDVVVNVEIMKDTTLEELEMNNWSNSLERFRDFTQNGDADYFGQSFFTKIYVKYGSSEFHYDIISSKIMNRQGNEIDMDNGDKNRGCITDIYKYDTIENSIQLNLGGVIIRILKYKNKQIRSAIDVIGGNIIKNPYGFVVSPMNTQVCRVDSINSLDLIEKVETPKYKKQILEEFETRTRTKKINTTKIMVNCY